MSVKRLFMSCVMVFCYGCNDGRVAQLVASVDSYYSVHGAPQTVNHIMISGIVHYDRENSRICNDIECSLYIEANASDLTEECVHLINEKHILLHGSIYDGVIVNMRNFYNFDSEEFLCSR